MKTASKKMDAGVNKLNVETKNQIKENKEAVAKMNRGVKFLNSEVLHKQKDFQDYTKAFWG